MAVKVALPLLVGCFMAAHVLAQPHVTYFPKPEPWQTDYDYSYTWTPCSAEAMAYHEKVLGFACDDIDGREMYCIEIYDPVHEITQPPSCTYVDEELVIHCLPEERDSIGCGRYEGCWKHINYDWANAAAAFHLECAYYPDWWLCRNGYPEKCPWWHH